jgi:cell division protein FtsL
MDNFSLYNQDFYAWTQKQAKALELDWQNLQEEVQSLGTCSANPSTARRKSKVKSQKSKVIWRKLFGD